MKRAAVITFLFLLSRGAASAADDDPNSSRATAGPTFYKDIAPIVHHHCTSCHRPGLVAPFSLLSYRDVQKRASLIARVTRERYMPPWKAEPGHGQFLGERRLSAAELDLIQQWVRDGSKEGDVSDLPDLPQFVDGWQLGEPDLVVTMPQAYSVPADGPDIYRNFVMPVTIPEGKFIKAVEYRPSNRRVVHHAIMSTVTGTAKIIDPGDGVSARLNPLGQMLPGPMAIWAPGKDPLPLPDGFAMAWPKEAQFILQLHLHPSGKPELEQSSIGFHFTSEPPRRQLHRASIVNFKVDIPPGEKAYRLTKSLEVPADVEVIGHFPHMHLLGREVKASAQLPDGTAEPLIWIRDWDFSWQSYYQFATPVRLPKGSRIDVEWVFDNSADNPRNPSQPPIRVTFGEQTTNEMAALLLDFTRPEPAAVRTEATISNTSITSVGE